MTSGKDPPGGPQHHTPPCLCLWRPGQGAACRWLPEPSGSTDWGFLVFPASGLLELLKTDAHHFRFFFFLSCKRVKDVPRYKKSFCSSSVGGPGLETPTLHPGARTWPRGRHGAGRQEDGGRASGPVCRQEVREPGLAAPRPGSVVLPGRQSGSTPTPVHHKSRPTARAP